jgi:hypothetical protein
VDCVPLVRLVQLELVSLAVELVAPVLEPVRPRNQDLSAAGWARLAGRVPVEQLPAARGIRAQPAAGVVDPRPLVDAGYELDLFAGGVQASRSSRWSPTRSEFAIAVSAGLTAPIDGKTLVSTT